MEHALKMKKKCSYIQTPEAMESYESFSRVSLERINKHQGRQKWGGNKAIFYVYPKDMKLKIELFTPGLFF